MRISELKRLVAQLVAGGGGGLVPDYASVVTSATPELLAEPFSENGRIPSPGPTLVTVNFQYVAGAGAPHQAAVGIYDLDSFFFEFGPGTIETDGNRTVTIPHVPAGWSWYALANNVQLTGWNEVPLVAG